MVSTTRKGGNVITVANANIKKLLVDRVDKAEKHIKKGQTATPSREEPKR